MATRRTSFAKLQRDRDKKARAAAKQERRQERLAEAEADTDVEPTDGGEELSASQLLAEVERLHQQFEDKKIDFETFEERKADLMARIPVD